MNWFQKLTFPLPVYVTRTSPDGNAGTWYVSSFVGLTVVLLGSLNALLWLGIGAYEAINFIV